MMTISHKRAKQRAKKIAREGGSHQNALDEVARDQGHKHWGEMKASGIPSGADHDADPDKWKGVSIIYPPFARRLGRDAVLEGIMRTSYLDLSHPIILRTIILDWFEAIEGRTSYFFYYNLIVGFADMTNSWVETQRVTGLSAWEPLAMDTIAKLATKMSLSEIEIAGLRSATEESVRKDFKTISNLLVNIQNGDGWLECTPKTWRSCLPDGFVLAQAKSKASDVSLSQWDAKFLVQALRRGLPPESDLAWDVSNAFFIASSLLPEGMDPEIFVNHVFRRKPEMPFPFEGMVRPVSNDDRMSRWISDAWSKMEEGGRPFSFNPLKSLSGEHSNVSAVMRSFVDLVPGDQTEEFRADAASLLQHLASLLHATKTNASELGLRTFLPSDGISLANIRDILGRFSSDMDQIVLYADIHDVAGMERLAYLANRPDLVRMASKALSPLADPVIAKALS